MLRKIIWISFFALLCFGMDRMGRMGLSGAHTQAKRTWLYLSRTHIHNTHTLVSLSLLSLPLLSLFLSPSLSPFAKTCTYSRNPFASLLFLLPILLSWLKRDPISSIQEITNHFLRRQKPTKLDFMSNLAQGSSSIQDEQHPFSQQWRRAHPTQLILGNILEPEPT